MADKTEGFMGRIKAATTAFWRPSRVGFGPADPIHPSTNEPLRRQDYMVGRNLLVSPRAEEGRSVTYAQMRELARTHGILRTVIEKRKDEVKGLEWGVSVKAEYANKGYEAETHSVRRFLERPDGTSFDQWMGALLEDVFVIDAPCLYRNKDMLGRLTSLDIVDGATIKVLVDDTGRIPDPPQPAYEQIIKGLPRTWWTKDELIYEPYNTSSDGVYGFSYVESIIMTVNIALRRDISFLEWFRSGNLPQAFLPAPESWTPDQIEQFQTMFDTYMSGDLAARSKGHMVPGSGQVTMVQQLTFDAMFDEWLARIICARFGVSPAPYVRMMNRATAETIEEASTQESLVPLMQHLKFFLDRVIAEDLGKPYLEFVWTSGQLHYKLADAQINELMVKTGAMTIDDWRKLKGQAPYPDGIGSTPMVWTSAAPVKLSDVVSGKFNPPTGAPDPMRSGAPAQLTQHPDGEAEVDNPFELSIRAMKTELDAWQTFSIRRLGRKSTRTFESKVLPPAVIQTVESALKDVTTAEAIKSVFEIARNNLQRRRTPSVDEPMSKLMLEYEARLRRAVADANKAEFNESEHPRVGSGPGGGQFTGDGGGGAGAGDEGEKPKPEPAPTPELQDRLNKIQSQVSGKPSGPVDAHGQPLPDRFQTVQQGTSPAPGYRDPQVKPKVKPKPMSKEPWQMTKQSYIAERQEGPKEREDYARAWVPIKDPLGKPNVAQFTPYKGAQRAGVFRWNDSSGVGRGILAVDDDGNITDLAVEKRHRGEGIAQALLNEAKRYGYTEIKGPATPAGLSAIHRNQVAQALRDGKPVPAEVLREYPDLTKAKA